MKRIVWWRRISVIQNRISFKNIQLTSVKRRYNKGKKKTTTIINTFSEATDIYIFLNIFFFITSKLINIECIQASLVLNFNKKHLYSIQQQKWSQTRRKSEFLDRANWTEIFPSLFSCWCRPCNFVYGDCNIQSIMEL